MMPEKRAQIFGLIVSLALWGLTSFASGVSFEEALKSLDGLSARERLARLEKEARREGRIRWSSSTNLDRIEPLLNAWKKKYPGIQIEYHRVTGRKLADLAIAEHRAGRHEIDILGTTAVTFLSLKEAGVLRPYVSPETGAFRSGMRDPQGYWVSEYSNVLAIICNKNRVKSPPRNWQDLTDRRWKGDFSIDSERFQWLAALQKIYGEEAAKQLMLAYRQNGALVRRGGTLQAQLVAAGEYSCTPGAYLNSAYLLKERGAPLNYSVPEPVMLSPSITMMTRFPPDPYAAMLFYDYSISPEGMSHFTRNNALFPSRENVPVVEDIRALEGKRLYFIDVEEQSRRYKELSETYQALVEK
jgi:iron(III) transport system substrate-binding protein